MWKSAVSLVILICNVTPAQQQLTAKEKAAWQKIEASVITLTPPNAPRASAALIDNSGLFLTQRSAFSGYSVEGVTIDGRQLQLTIVGVDAQTGLACLQAKDWTPGTANALSYPFGPLRQGARLFAALPGGVMRAELEAADRPGYYTASKRVLPLNAFKFEAPASQVAGALIFTVEGELVGALDATLQAPQALNSNQSQLGGLAPPTFVGKASIFSQQFGPGQLAVAYTPGSDTLRLVIDGFRSPSHKVLYPKVGIFCEDAIGGGALITSVRADGTGEKAGLKRDDIIVSINGRQIGGAVDFAKVMLGQRVGVKIPFVIKRGGATLVVDTVVGS